MTTVTGMHAWSGSQRVLADAHGNNVAFACLNCGGPVLATLMLHQRGSSEEKPTECRVCSAKFWVEPQVARNRLLVHRSKTPESGRYGRSEQVMDDARRFRIVARIASAGSLSHRNRSM